MTIPAAGNPAAAVSDRDAPEISVPSPARREVRRRAPWFDFKRSLGGRATFVLGASGVVLFLAAWQIAANGNWISSTLFPPPTAVGEALRRLFVEQEFAADVWASLVRIAISFSIAAAIALPLGVLMGAFPAVEAFFNPLVAAFRYLPATAFIPLFLMWLGAGEEQKLALLVLGVVFFLITLLMDNTKQVRAELIETAKTMGATRRQILWTVVVRASLPAYVDTLRQMLAIGWTYLVVAEIVATTDGIGAMMMRAKRFVHVDEIMAGIVVIGALGLALDGLFRLAHRFAFPYLRYAK
jgi:NitT/TauT family transport system permease protein